ncbi:hypothetical protein PoB_007002500 [Plakobranchus ocellatus]|uniref:Uncharacterized protein n=1 Tax=Plakobranchus ocellatus TaxID=259542 RepID=A0AAV4DHT1_9GAST|nr:hypothetical protein PoB_007002500 [Plakobranchus ocellatus]
MINITALSLIQYFDIPCFARPVIDPFVIDRNGTLFTSSSIFCLMPVCQDFVNKWASWVYNEANCKTIIDVKTDLQRQDALTCVRLYCSMWGRRGTVDGESALRSAGTFLSWVRAPSPAPWPDGGPGSL